MTIDSRNENTDNAQLEQSDAWYENAEVIKIRTLEIITSVVGEMRIYLQEILGDESIRLGTEALQFLPASEFQTKSIHELFELGFGVTPKKEMIARHTVEYTGNKTESNEKRKENTRRLERLKEVCLIDLF